MTVSLTMAPAAPATATGTAAAPGATTVAAQDFLLMLGQLLGAAAPPPAVAAQGAPAMAVTDADTDATESLDSAALEAMLPFAFATPVNVPTPAQAAVSAADAISSLDVTASITSGVAGIERSFVAAALTGGLAEASDVDASDAAMFANLNASSTATPTDDAQAARAAASSDASRGLHTPVGSSEWGDELGARLTLMAERGGHQVASLRLSPEHLGPLEVRISIRDDQASVWFGAAHADTRAAIEQALPRLREMFGVQGLSLADTGVFREAPRDQQPAAPGSAGSHADSSDSEVQVISIAHRRLGLVDAYA